MKRTFPLILIILLLSPSAPVWAQDAVTASTTRTAANQSVLNALSVLPEADALIFLNPPRILNEAAPKFMSEQDLAGMRQGFEEVKKNAGIDPTKVDYLVLAIRFRKPAADLTFIAPDVLLVAGGDFSADSLVTLARLAAGGRVRDEAYASKTLGLMTIDPLVTEAEKNPILKPYTEVGIVALNSTTVAVGTTGYLKAAVDSNAGTGRIDSKNLAALLRDPSALISAAGSPWTSFSKTLGLRGTESTSRAANCESQLGDFYVGVTMDAANFLVRGTMNADNPDTAKIINNLFSGLVKQASSVPDPTAQALLKLMTLTPEESEVVLKADIPHQMVIDYFKKLSEPKKEEAAASAPASKTTTPAKKRTVRRKRTRTK